MTHFEDAPEEKNADSPVETGVFEKTPPDAALTDEAPSAQPLGIPEQTTPFYRRNPVTVSFSLILGLLYALTSFQQDFQHPAKWALMWFSFYPPLVQAGEWWRFITATLMHGNPSHLFNNVVGILIFGNLLEPLIGSRRLIYLYVLSAFWGLLFSYILLPGVPTFGASTIDYGLIGAYLGLTLLVRFRRDRRVFWGELRSALTFVVIFVVWNTMESLTVNLWGHVGGLLAGILFAVWLLQTRRPQGT